jgi:hypothetical protein
MTNGLMHIHSQLHLILAPLGEVSTKDIEADLAFLEDKFKTIII